VSATNDGDRLSTPFDPLLRELLTFNLVEADDEEGVRRWHLTEDACRRLAHLAAPPPPEEKVVHFSRRCVRCGEHRPTRRHSEGFVCEECSREPVVSKDPAHTGLSELTDARGMTA
jgi:ribosomal protein S14